MRGEKAHLAHFANLIDLFASSDIGAFANLMVSVGARSDAVDIKKVGTFPIVHGTRTLAIEKGILETRTVDRINAIAEHPHFQRRFRPEPHQRAACVHGIAAPVAAQSAAARQYGGRNPSFI